MSKAPEKEKPPPSSKEARRRGCICPILDNEFGAGMMGMSRYFVVVEGCPIHTYADAVKVSIPERFKFKRTMPKISLVLAWYDFWVGVFWDRNKRCLYVLPVPCLGICIDFK